MNLRQREIKLYWFLKNFKPKKNLNHILYMYITYMYVPYILLKINAATY